MTKQYRGNIKETLSEMMGTYWIGVKFHKTRPLGIKLSFPATFCAAAERAVTEPVLLKVADITCAGAKYAFNFPGAKPPMFGGFIPGRLHKLIDLKQAVVGTPRLDFTPDYVSFNLPNSSADLYLSFMMFESANELAQFWAQVSGEKLSCKFTGVTGYCSEGAAGSLSGKIPTLSLGCVNAIKKAAQHSRICVCLPENAAGKLAEALLSTASARKAA